MQPELKQTPAFSVIFLLMLSVGWTSGKDPVNAAEIQKYLNEYYDKLEKSTGIPDSFGRKAIQDYVTGKKKLINGKDKSYSVSLFDVAQVLISVEKYAATLKYDEACDISIQEDLVDELYVDGRKDWNWADRSFGETFDHFKKLDGSGKSFCNFFANLRCQHDKTKVPPHRCTCSPRMTWQDGKCVFKEGQKCDIISEMRQEDKVFAVFDFKAQDFTREIPPNCEGGTLCQSKKRKSNRCESNRDFDLLASPFELSVFLRRHIPDAIKRNSEYSGANDEAKEEITYFVLRHVLKDITLINRRSFRLALSLEMKTEGRLLDNGGKPCDPTVDGRFEARLKKYNADSYEWYQYLDTDVTRYRYLKQVVRDNVHVCNHFKRLTCDTSSKTCGCKYGFVYDLEKKHCVRAQNFLCEGPQTKQFQLNLAAADLGESISENNIAITYFKHSEPRTCQSGLSCMHFYGFAKFCVASGEQTEMTNLQLEFEKKFFLEIDGDCSITAQDELVKEANAFDWKTSKTLDEAKTIIKTLIGKPNSYCRIRRLSECSKDSGKCVCLKPSVRSTTSGTGTSTCVLPYNWQCKYLHRSELHKVLDRLFLPIDGIKKNEIEKENHLLCNSLSDCTDLPSLSNQGICACPEEGKYGEHCDRDPSHHLAHLSFTYLPASMRNPVGIKIISELHDPLTELDAKMTLKYGDKCDSPTNKEFADIMEFLALVRETCDCFWTEPKGWMCSSDNCYTTKDPTFQQPKFQAVLQNAKTLASKSPVLCNWNRAERCVDSKCDCPADFFHESGNCRVDLGGLCYKWTKDDDHTRTCRLGLQCSLGDPIRPSKPSKTYCEHKHLEWNPCTGCGPRTPEKYVSDVKDKLIEILNKETEDLKKLQTSAQGATCNPESEIKLKSEFEQIKAVVKMVESSGTIQTNRQHVRHLDTYLNSERKLKHLNFCKKELVCSDKNKCEKEGSGSGNNNNNNGNKKPAPGVSFAPAQVLPMNFLILHSWTFALIQLLW